MGFFKDKNDFLGLHTDLCIHGSVFFVEISTNRCIITINSKGFLIFNLPVRRNGNILKKVKDEKGGKITW